MNKLQNFHNKIKQEIKCIYVITFSHITKSQPNYFIFFKRKIMNNFLCSYQTQL